MNKTKIEWCDYTVNPVKGLCPMGCSYCYARRMYKRFRLDENIRFDANALLPIADIKTPSRIFVGSTIELFGDWVDETWLWHIFNAVRQFHQHTFIFLTKQPQNLIKWAPFPDNCWVGVSTTGFDCRSGLEDVFGGIQARVRFLSIEPLLGYTPMDFKLVDWIIIGQQTPPSPKTRPRIEWVNNIITAADNRMIPVFIKNNILQDKELITRNSSSIAWFRQEYPHCRQA